MDELIGKVALVTGASRGIGAATAATLAQAGAKVVCAARTAREAEGALLPGSLEHTVAEITAAGGDAVAVPVNLADEAGTSALVDAAREAYGKIDVLVNNAAVGFFGSITDLKLSRWNVSWRITVTAPLQLAQLVLPEMIERGDGRIINVTSESAVGPGPGPYPADREPIGDTAYGAQKAAIERITQGIAQEVQPHGVGVAAVAPSLIVPTPGALFNSLISGPQDPRAEDPAYV